MTGNFFIDNAISAAGIAFVVLVVFLLFRPRAAPVTEEEARARIAIDEPDYAIVSMLIAESGRAVLARNEGGEFIIVSRIGADLITRRFNAGGAKVLCEDDALTIALSDITTPDFDFGRIEGAVEWARALRGDHGKIV